MNLNPEEESILDMVDRIFGGSVDLEELENNDLQFQQQLDDEEQEWAELQENDLYEK